MNLKTIFFTITALACGGLANAFPNSVVMVGNLPDTNGGYVFDSQAWFAESFTVPGGSGYVILDGIAISLQRQGHPVGGQNRYKIFGDNAGKPGKPLILLSFPTLAPTRF